MRECTKCGVLRPDSEYFMQNKSTGRLHAECKLCYTEHRKTYAAEHYKKYGDLYRKRALERKRITKARARKFLQAYLADKCCVICGKSDPIVLDFDHLDPSQKSFGISWACGKGMKWDEILLEINKCRVLCANCHRKHTAVQFNWYHVRMK